MSGHIAAALLLLNLSLAGLDLQILAKFPFLLALIAGSFLCRIPLAGSLWQVTFSRDTYNCRSNTYHHQ